MIGSSDVMRCLETVRWEINRVAAQLCRSRRENFCADGGEAAQDEKELHLSGRPEAECVKDRDERRNLVDVERERRDGQTRTTDGLSQPSYRLALGLAF